MPSLSYFGGQLFKAPSTAIILRLKNSEVAQNHRSLPLHNLFTLPSGGVVYFYVFWENHGRGSGLRFSHQQ